VAEITLDALPDPAIVLRSDGRVTAVNELAAEMFGSAGWLLDQDAGCSLGDVAPLLEWLADGRGPAVMRRRLKGCRRNNVPIVIDVSARRSAPGEALCILHELREDRLAGEAQRYFDVAFDHAPIGMALFNTDGEYIRVNSALCAMLGRSVDELIGRRDQEFTHPDDRQSDVEAAWRILEGEIDTWQCEKRFLRPDGTVVWAIANLTFLRSADGHPLSWVGQFQDITRSKVQEARLQELAERDALTGLFNRRRLESELSYRIGHGHGGALMLMDLNRFKEINDAHGHRAGDLVLVTVASVLREAVRDTDLVARIGGDEFAILLHDAEEHDAQALADLIADVMRAQRFGFDAHASVSASVGVATFGADRKTTPDALVAAADSAMYRAKGAGPTGARGGRRRTDPEAGEPAVH
jgi:diguanylate cyclase (GGDEF)-like protein/PAS domain S-box-containing protein